MVAKAEKAAFLREAEGFYDELRLWREKNPDASFDEIAAQVTPRRRVLMGQLLEQMAVQHGDGTYATAICSSCEAEMEGSGRRSRDVLHSEGDTQLERAYHHCPVCGRGFFPPGPEAEAGGTLLDSENN
jgi:hypothetical protein